VNLGLLEDRILPALAKDVVPEGGSGVDNTQISGLLSTIRASGSYAVLRTMTQHQFEKARKEGDRSADRAAFYDRLFKALQQVENHADKYARAKASQSASKSELKKDKDRWSGHLASILMTHVAAEHWWQGSGR
jgi:hypothetical protein